MLRKFSSMLDDIANRLEKKGLIKEAYEIDKIADKISSEQGLFSEELDAAVDDMKHSASAFFETMKKLDQAFRLDDLGMIGKLYSTFKKQADELGQHMIPFTKPPYQS